MSAPKLISPMLDGFSVGEAISSHNGVTCYPAMRDNLDDKYIVKVISVPASEVQLAALLLSGAYSSREEALRYYKERAQEIVQEARMMNSLGHLEGFAPYLDCQIAEKEDLNGYAVYLLNVYQKSLEQVFSDTVITHRSIMNLAMDLCNALAACRRAGYLYIDLKPSNIFYSEEYGYRISDLGFIPLTALKYASLPEKYHSLYTAPEIADAVSQLNTTLDVYALGMVLYQAYNGGSLPVENGVLTTPLLPPMYADYEMAEILLKACDPDPDNRWSDPAALGQALAQYMSRNPVEDTPIIPADITTPELDASEDFLPEEDMDEDWGDIPDFYDLESQDLQIPSDVDASQIMTDDDTAQILAQADDLIAHELPDPVVTVEIGPISIPELPVEEEPQPSASEPETPVAAQIPPVCEPEPEPAEAPEVTPAEIPAAPAAETVIIEKKKQPVGRWILMGLAALLLFAGICGGIYYYQNIYLQSVDGITITGDQTTVTVQLETDIEEDLLTVICSDAYGNTFKSKVVNGSATFTGLAPQTHYAIRVTIDGFHKLIGNTTGSYATPSQTNILSFTASIGPADGSVYLNFTVRGVESDEWTVTYSSANTEPQSVSFAGHSITIYDLIMGEDYTFTLQAADGANVVGQTEVSFVVRPIIRAQNPVITACGNGLLTVVWDTPEGETEITWTVRCYDESGYEQTFTTDGNSYTFSGLSHNSSCTVAIIAEGMNQGVSVQIQADPINITQFQQTATPAGVMINWIYTGQAPEGGWIVSWSCDGSPVQNIPSEIESIMLPYIPGGNYLISLFTADGSPVFGHSYSFQLPEASVFSGLGLTTDDLTFMMCATPSEEEWYWDEIPQDDYRTAFISGETAGFIIWCEFQPEAAEEEVEFSFVLRNSDGILVEMNTQTAIWNVLWDQGFCEISVPQMPQQAGSYTLWIYLNGQYLHDQNFTVS